jgi:hypothetical protein
MYGDPWASVYRVGPNLGLLDRRVGTLDVRATAAAGGVRAAMANGRLLRRVSRRGPIVPTRITGRLEGLVGERRRDLAVAVNGRIRAVGRSFRLGRRRAIFFSFVVPESALRPGANRAEVFEVGDDGRTLTSLGRVS